MIRKITPADREVYLKMAWDFYHSEAVLHAVPDSHYTRAFDEMMRSEDYLLGLIFEHENKTAGYALLCKTWSQEAGGAVVWIDELYILPEFQCRGLGRAFFAELQKIAPAARYRLEIEPDNTRAERLYNAMGFETLGYKQLVKETPDIS